MFTHNKSKYLLQHAKHHIDGQLMAYVLACTLLSANADLLQVFQLQQSCPPKIVEH